MPYNFEIDDNLKITEINRGYFVFSGMVMAALAIVAVAFCNYYFEWHTLISELIGISLFTLGIAVLCNQKSITMNGNLREVVRKEFFFFFLKSTNKTVWEKTEKIVVTSSMTGGAFGKPVRFFFTITLGGLQILTCSDGEDAFACSRQISEYLDLPVTLTGVQYLFDKPLWDEYSFSEPVE